MFDAVASNAARCDAMLPLAHSRGNCEIRQRDW
jgi:hypothetical protein